MLTKAFALASLERAIKTFAQSLAALLVADGTNLLNTNWADRLSVAGMAAVVSVLTSVASAGVGVSSGPSLGAETLTPAVAAVAKSQKGLVAGPAADVPEGDPVDVVPDPPIVVTPGDDEPQPQGGYWGGV